MADKRYYWIKLKTEFFSLDEIDFLLSQKNGCEYVVLYQMLCLNTANNRGKLMTKIGEMIVPFDVEKIVRDTKYFDFDTVAVALELFKQLGLVYESKNDILEIANFDEMVGSETSSAKRVREWRNKKSLQCNTDVTQNVTSNENYNVAQESRVDRVKSLDIRDKSLDIDKTDFKKDKMIKRYNDKIACANFVTQKLFNDSLINEEELTNFDEIILKFLDDYDPLDVIIKATYVLHKINGKNISNRPAYFYKAMSTNLKENYNIEKQALDLDVDIDELNETLKQFE